MARWIRWVANSAKGANCAKSISAACGPAGSPDRREAAILVRYRAWRAGGFRRVSAGGRERHEMIRDPDEIDGAV
ncbi:hypothetical protein [Paraburkholderia sp. J94]|uniref:hypothetical protein n=1 Tax=Paraburkholderia sp. J94 TaxID=2805441 RepID=UPI002AB046CE|nr:hypothetical protein [Paraburkholderia sp. J94]